MNIGEVAKAAGVSAKMVRHYESVRLLRHVPRTDSGYRQYTDADVHTLRFVRHARDLGFSIDQIRELVGLWQNKRRASRQVKLMAESHLRELDEKLAELHAMRATLSHLVQCCHGNERPDCPILDTLASAAAEGPAAVRHGKSSHLRPHRGGKQPS